MQNLQEDHIDDVEQILDDDNEFGESMSEKKTLSHHALHSGTSSDDEAR